MVKRAEFAHPTVDGRFDLIELAGRGGMASVYRAVDVTSGLEVAVKIAVAEEEARARFEREAAALAIVEHPNVARYLAHGVLPDGRVYLAMEWIEGESLATNLRRGPLSMEQTLALGSKVARALGAVHARGLVHRDVKPGNIVLRDNDPARPVLLDFGLAKPVVGDEITSVGLSVGTPGYMAPEQARGLAKLDARADVFALGCLIFRCATGVRPFGGPTVTAVLAKLLFDAPPSMRAIDPRISASLDELVLRMLIKDPADRLRDVSRIADELDELAARRAQSAPRVRSDGVAITPDELHPVSVIVVGGPTLLRTEGQVGAVLDVPTLIAPAENSEVLLRPAPAPLAREATVALAESFGAVAETLANGALVVVFQGGSNARDQCVRAARCALRLKDLVPNRPVTLATGRARTSQGEIVGEAVERAVAALDRTDAHGVHIDEASALLLGPAFEVARDVGLRLMFERGDGFAQRTLLGATTPCVGRETEIGTVLGTWTQCVEDAVARVIVLTADAGVGKSRLASEVVLRVMETDSRAQVWLARGDALTEHAPLALVGRVLRQQAGVQPGDALELRRTKLRARAARHLLFDAVANTADFLGELCGVPFDDSGRPALKAARSDAQLMSTQLRAAFEEIVMADAAAGPVLLVLEDLHWADDVSVAWFERVLSRISDRPVLLLALTRPEAQARFGALFSAGSHLHMKPLTAKAATKLAHAVLGEDAPADRVARVVQLAGGNAFYLEELLRAVAEGQDELPQTVVLMAQARLQTLDPEARRVLRAASVFGDTFTQDDVAALFDDEAAAQWLPRLVKLEMIAHTPGAADGFSFRHALLREAAYASLTDSDRTLGHKLAGEWLETLGDRNAMAIADHFARGDEPEAAVVRYVRAAEQALEAGDFQAPNTALSRARACGAQGQEHGRLLALVARATWQRGDMATAEQLAREAIALLPPFEPHWYEAIADLTNALQGKLDNAGIEAVSRELLAEAPRGPVTVSYVRAISLAYTLLIQHAPGSDLTRALSDAIEQIAASDAARDPLIEARLSITRAYAAVARKHPSAARLFEHSAIRFEAVGNIAVAQMQRLSHGVALGWLGAWEEAIGVFTAIPESHARPARWARVFLAWPLAQMGRTDDGIAAATSVLLVERDDPFLILETHLALARVLLKEGRHAEALVHLAPALVDKTLPPQVQARVHAIAFEAYFSVDRAVATEHARTVEGWLANKVPLVEDEVYVRLAAIESRRASGDLDGARSLADETAAMIRACAALIERKEHVTSYLERVPENARVLEIARELTP